MLLALRSLVEAAPPPPEPAPEPVVAGGPAFGGYAHRRRRSEAELREERLREIYAELEREVKGEAEPGKVPAAKLRTKVIDEDEDDDAGAIVPPLDLAALAHSAAALAAETIGADRPARLAALAREAEIAFARSPEGIARQNQAAIALLLQAQLF